MKKHLLSVFAVVIFAAMAIASNSTKDDEKKATESNAPPIEITAKNLASDYAANEVSADQKYKGKVLQVTGSVESINKDFTDGIYIVLTGTDDMGMDGIHCEFSSDHANDAAALSKGQKITIKGIGNGYMMGSATLSGCTVVK